MSLATGNRLGPYEILASLGAGGMGEVYRARDTRLGREVAIKVLPAEFADDPDRLRRFEQEARAVAALDHPNILAIFDVGAERDVHYLVTELLEGETLRARLQKGALPARRAVELAIQIAQGLEAAHEKGIVHRDLKPANVFITKNGHVKILDFGIAKLLPQREGSAGAEATTDVGATEAGAVLGTVGYMSPEQVRGGAVDHRSDIFSFGCVLYEMLSARSPFLRDTGADTAAAILREDPPPIAVPGREVPEALRAILDRCLEKHPEDRFSSAHDLALVLGAVNEPATAGQPHGPSEKSIVVLPFQNLSPDPENEFFADGLTEELISDLSKVASLRVISRTSAMLLKGSKKDVPTIARELDVGFVLEGSVRRAGPSLRITAQLIDAASDAHLWAEKFSGTLDDVFAIQEKVSAAIVEGLKLRLTPREAERLAEHPIPNALAFELYFKARQELMKWTEAGLENAATCLRNGLEIAGPNAVLFAGLAYVCLQYGNLGLKDTDTCASDAEGYLEEAFALDPECPQGHLVLALLRVPARPREGIMHLRRVLEANPNDFDAVFFLCCALGTIGQARAALPLEELAARLDPLNAAGHFHLGFNRLWEGEFSRARQVLEQLSRSFPDDPLTTFAYGLSLAYLGEKERASAVFAELARRQPGTMFATLGLGLTHALEGRRSDVANTLAANPNLLRTRDFQYAYWVAACYAVVDEREAALDWLERDVSFGMINYPFLNERDPFLASLRAEPRFQRLMARVRVEWERLEA